MLEVLAGRDDRDMTSSQRPVEAYLNQLDSSLEGKVIALPAREDIDFDINEQLIVEFYSK